MDNAVVWIFLFLGFGSSQVPPRKYYYVDTEVNFIEAQNYCREHFTDVATITSKEDISMLTRPSSNRGSVWIGLNDDAKAWKGVMGNDSNSWRWSVTGQTSKTSYCNWLPGQPDFWGADETCVVTNLTGLWSDIPCDKQQMSICFDTNATVTSYVLVTTLLTWKDAQTNCRQFYKDLALIENAEDNAALQSLHMTTLAWIGLYRIPWTWSDKSNSTFRNFAVGKPDNAQEVNYCVAELPDHTWSDTPCTPNLAFFCHKDTQWKTTLRIKIRADGDMTDQAFINQILQQIQAALMNQGWNLFKLKWTTEKKIGGV